MVARERRGASARSLAREVGRGGLLTTVLVPVFLPLPIWGSLTRCVGLQIALSSRDIRMMVEEASRSCSVGKGDGTVGIDAFISIMTNTQWY